MEIVFLGTGSAWCLPEYSCRCAVCTRMIELGEERTRSSFLLRGRESVLVDCGPDLRLQMSRCGIEKPDLILITHEHGDHYLGIDDLLAFRRSVPPDAWKPVPVYATEPAWKSIEVRFGYLLGSLIEKRVSAPGVPLEGTNMRITPFKTDHGPSAPGSVGYVVEDDSVEGPCKVVYTSDFMRLPKEPDVLYKPDVLVMQSHWLNEPVVNRPFHMSFQNALPYIKRWEPVEATYLVHICAGDKVAGDPYNDILKKLDPADPLSDPRSGEPYPVPLCGTEWQTVIDRICADFDVPGPVIVPADGMKAVHPRGTAR